MQTWDYKKDEYIETPKKLNDFFNELEALYKKYEYSISHEDGRTVAMVIAQETNKNIIQQ